MAALQAMQPQSTSTATIIKDINSNSMAELVPCSRQNFLTKAKRRQFTKLEAVLFILLVLLVIGFVVTTVLLVLRKSRESCDNVDSPVDAIESFARIFSKMDRNADPCTDFYQYACGGYLKKTHIDDSDVSIFPFKQGLKENQRTLKEIFEDKKLRSNYSSSPSVLKAFHMYMSCMNTTTIEKFGDTDLKELLGELGVFNITKNQTKSGGYRWHEVVVKVKRKLNIDSLFKIEVLDDIRNSSIRRVVMRAVDLGLDYASYSALNNPNITKNDSRVMSKRSAKKRKEALFSDTPYQIWTDKMSETAIRKLIRKYYVEYMTDLMSLIFTNRTVVEENMKDVFEFETKIALTQLPPNKRNDFSVIFNLVSIHTLTNMTAKFDWLGFVRSLTSGAGYNITKDEKLIISSREMLRKIMNILSETEPKVISNYIAWRVVTGLLDVLPKKYSEKSKAFQSKVFRSDVQDIPRWSKCVTATSKALPLTTAAIYAENVLPPGTVTKSKTIIVDVKEALLKILPDQLWMDEKSQNGAMEKVKGIIFHVGYPGNLSKPSLLKNVDREFQVSNKSYFFTYVNVKSYTFMENIKSLKSMVDRNEYEGEDSLTPRAFYFPTRNKVEFSVGMLNSPFYDIKNFNSINYGAFGTVVGHEITHGFDLRGHRFDKNGRQFGWMSEYPSQALENRTVCFRNKLSKLKHQGSSFQPSFDITREIFSDAGGLTLAFKAYQQWKKYNSEKSVFPSLRTTHDQLFFLSYAQMWCSKYKEREIHRMFLAGNNLPFMYRVRGAVMNSRDFDKVFSCPVGSVMNPKDKCDVW